MIPRASQAILLGHSLLRPSRYVFLSKDPKGAYTGCACGMMTLALGHEIPDLAWCTGIPIHSLDGVQVAWMEYMRPQLLQDYPWMESYRAPKWPHVDFITQISKRFAEVTRNEATIEQLCDWVRSIEPDCDCMRYGCSCKEAQDVAPVQEAVSVAS